MISSLGLIEVVGLVGAIEAGDTAVKAANVRLIGLELTKGGGMVTVKIEGEVSAVTAAVEAGVMAAERLTTVVSKLVIARPSLEVGKMVEPLEEPKQEEKEEVVEIKEEVVEENVIVETQVAEPIETVTVEVVTETNNRRGRTKK